METLRNTNVATDAEFREKVLEQLKAIPFEDDEDPSSDDDDMPNMSRGRR